VKRRVDEEPLRTMIEQQRLTQHEAAKRLGVCLSAVERACRKFGLKTQRTGPRSGDGHTNWKGGRYLLGATKGRAYWYVYAPTHPNRTKAGYVAEHRLLMSQAMGRPLHKGEVVHHKDGNPQNNALSNLQLFDANGRHLEHELTGRCPQWTPRGMERIAEGVRRSHIARGHKVSDAQAHNQTTSRWIAKVALSAPVASQPKP